MNMLLVAASVVMAAADAGGGAGGPAAWQTPAWASFRRAWERVAEAKDVATLRSVQVGLPALESDLAAVVPAGLAGRLVAAVETRAEMRERALKPSRGKPTAIDWPARLRREMAELEQEQAALVELRALGFADPWVSERFAADVAFLARAVEDGAGVVEREYRGERELARQARALVAKIRPSLMPPR